MTLKIHHFERPVLIVQTLFHYLSSHNNYGFTTDNIYEYTKPLPLKMFYGQR